MNVSPRVISGVIAIWLAVCVSLIHAQQITPAKTSRSSSAANTQTPGRVMNARPVAYGSAGGRARSYVPPHLRVAGTTVAGETVIDSPQTPTVYEDVSGDVGYGQGDGGCCGNAQCGHSGCGGGSCHADGPCQGGCMFPCPRFSLQNMMFYAGAHGFVNPRTPAGPQNRAHERARPDGSFGFQEGLNWGFNFPCMPCENVAGQLGFEVNQSNLSGASFTPDTRSQLFVTGGLFRRVDWGLQGGVVLDYLHDDWYVQQDLVQLRGELSWVYPSCAEVGFSFATSDHTSTSGGMVTQNGMNIQVTETWEPIDYYTLFYRTRFCRGGEGRVFGGFSDKSDGLAGADVVVPISDHWAVQGGFTYLIPQGGNNQMSGATEVWNVGINLVWYPACFDVFQQRYNRPLFNVANNGSFLITRQ